MASVLEETVGKMSATGSISMDEHKLFVDFGWPALVGRVQDLIQLVGGPTAAQCLTWRLAHGGRERFAQMHCSAGVMLLATGEVNLELLQYLLQVSEGCGGGFHFSR